VVLLAVRRERRAEAEGWQEAAAAIDGVEVLDSASPSRAMARVTPGGLAELRSRLGQVLHIEPPVSHNPADHGTGCRGLRPQEM
jgi:hypothetical protein